ncbi:MAG: hypothetical protein Q7R66_09790 [Undibacterium sp.]|uniref:hypothetical protein n=1 Tax=Undibacterium sp. TaxID=1914977 RepID=UPI00272582D7|nr:hypothetical protein [Undibacterium sp.]MDO8652469.1 hypothetical protein [Undibacterium sp.]
MSKIKNQNLKYLDCSNARKQKIKFQGNSLEERLLYTYKGIPIGRLAYYDLSIKFKRYRARIDLNRNELVYYDSIISDGVGIVDFLENSPVAKLAEAVIAIDEYSLANVVRTWARKKDISALRAGLSYHFNADPQFITLSADRTRASEKCTRAAAWVEWKNIPLPSEVVKEISSDLIFRMSSTGGHIFSSNYSGNYAELLSYYGFRPEIKTLALFTSANDEIDAIEELSNALLDTFEVKDAFVNQLDWIKYIIEYANSHDVQVIIKIHPRLAKSHRDAGVAEDINLYKNLSNSAKSNVVFIWPEDDVSAYDILQFADICLTSWGTMGLEAAKLGIPVVSGITRITFATPHLALFSKAETVDQFYRMITQPLNKTRLEDIVEAFRWHHLLHMAGSLVIRGRRNINLYSDKFETRFSDVLQGVNIVDEKYKFLLEQTNLKARAIADQEILATSDAIKKIIKFFDEKNITNMPSSKLIVRLQAIAGSLDHD